MASDEFDDDVYQKLVELDRRIQDLDEDILGCQKSIAEDLRNLPNQSSDEKHYTIQRIIHYKHEIKEFQRERRELQDLLNKLENKYWGKGFHYHWEEDTHEKVNYTLDNDILDEMNFTLDDDALYDEALGDDALDLTLGDDTLEDALNLTLHF